MFNREVSGTPDNSSRAPSDNPFVSLADVIHRVWRARWFAIAGGVAFVALAVVATQVLKPSYESSTQVYVDPRDLQLLENDLTPSSPYGDSGVIITESQARIMQSVSVLRSVVERLDLVNDDEFGPSKGSLLSGIRQMLRPGPSTPSDPLQEAVDKLAKAVHVVRADRTYVIEVYAKSAMPVRAAQIADAVVAAYLDLRESQRSDQADSASQSLERRLEGLLASVKADEDAVEHFKIEHGIVGTNGSLLVESRLSELNLAVAAAEQAMNEAQVRHDQLSRMRDNPEQLLSSPEAMGSAELARMRDELTRARNEMALLSSTLGPRHQRLVAARSQFEAIRAGISAELDRLTSNAALARQRAQSQYEAAVAALTPLTGQLQDMDAARIQLRQLERKAESSRAVYEETLLRSRETRERGMVSTLNAQVISPATVPVRRSFPPSLSLLLPLALIMGTGLGALTGMAWQAARPHLRPLRTVPAAKRVTPPVAPVGGLSPRWLSGTDGR